MNGRRVLWVILGVGLSLLVLWLALLAGLQGVIADILSYPETPQLPYDVARTLVRITAAYLLTLAFGIAYGITAGLHARAEHVMIPILDILQSIPVLGYLVPVLLFMLYLFPGVIGQELTSIFLIFTGMAWAVCFNVYGAVKSIPNYIVDVSKLYGITDRRYIREVIFPAMMPALISGSILAVGGGWYFLIATEFVSFGSGSGAIQYSLPGLGSYIWKAAFTSQTPHLDVAMFGLAVLALIVALVNQFIWHPLLDYSTRFSQESAYYTHYRRRRAIVQSKVSQTILKEFKVAASPLVVAPSRFGALSSFLHTHPLPHPPLPRARWRGQLSAIRPKTRFATYIITALFVASILVLLFVPITGRSVTSVVMGLKLEPAAYQIPSYAFWSSARLFAGYLIVLGWTIPVGIIVARSKRLSSIFLPLFDIGQSVPALALFPIYVIIFIDAYGDLGTQLASVFLVITGMQWYLLFNIIGAVKNIPSEILESAQAFGMRGVNLFRHVIFPAILPSIILGSIQAWGGGWNATIVSEYIVDPAHGTTRTALGLGYLLDYAVANQDITLVVLSIMTMSVIVILLNRTIWHYLLKKSSKYRYEI